ncbi:hypothetical protein ACIGZJ_30905 [Kitasatospora sp. NPDC052868]|uniref:hypothetical protein n=1 Tax=Kitasatospora sp. NPDC052868 TaxID=3364060 RepID=UPI0037C655DF
MTALHLAAITAAGLSLITDPNGPAYQDPDVTADLARIQRITDWLPHWPAAGTHVLERNLHERNRAEDRLLAAHGYPVPDDDERYRARLAISATAAAVQAAADLAHPPADCTRCNGWEDCADADLAFRHALHADWVDRWAVDARQPARRAA